MVNRTARAVGVVLALCVATLLSGFAQSQPQSNEDMQKKLEGLKSEMGQMQEKMAKLRQKLTELAQSGASAEEIEKAMQGLNKEFGFGGAVRKYDTAGGEKADKEKKDEEEHDHSNHKEEEAKEEARPAQPAVWLGFNGNETDDGFEVTRFNKNSPAKKAGLQKGDVVTKFNGADVTNAVEIVEKEAPLKPGDKASLTVLRDGKEVTIELTLENRPATLEDDDKEADEGKEQPEDKDEDDQDMHKDHKNHDRWDDATDDDDDQKTDKDHKHHGKNEEDDDDEEDNDDQKMDKDHKHQDKDHEDEDDDDDDKD